MSPPQTLYLRSLRRALELSDGPEQLAADLRLSVEYLKLLLAGVMHVPEEAFFRVADFLIDRAVTDLTERSNAAAGLMPFGRKDDRTDSELADLREFTENQAAASESPSARKRDTEPSFIFKWLAVDKFKRLTPTQKDAYVLELTKQLGVRVVRDAR